MSDTEKLLARLVEAGNGKKNLIGVSVLDVRKVGDKYYFYGNIIVDELLIRQRIEEWDAALRAIEVKE